MGDDSATPSSTTSKSLSSSCFRHASHPSNPKRFIFQYNGNSIYEWEQSLDEVIIYIPLPQHPENVVLKGSMFHVRITPTKLQVGFKNNNNAQPQQQYFIDEPTFGTVNTEESTWTLEEGNIVIYLSKANLGVVWEAALKGRNAVSSSSSSGSGNTATGTSTSSIGAMLDPGQLEQVKQQLMLERWSKENPGMDFSSAQFNGMAPDPRTFMGGTKYS